MRKAEGSGRSPETGKRSGAKNPKPVKSAQVKNRPEQPEAEKRQREETTEELEAKFAEIINSVDAGARKPAKRGGTRRVEARTVAFLEPDEAPAVKNRTKAAGATKKSAQGEKPVKRTKARKPNEKITPAAIFRKMLNFGKIYQIENEQDFQEAARIYAEEAGLIDQMRDRLAEDGLTVLKTYKTGDVEVAHPLLSELPRHVESANKCLSTIGSMISERGARVEKAKRDLDKFRMNA